MLGVAVFLAPAGTQWDQSLVDALADQSSLGLRNAVARERERQRAPTQHDLLSALGTELAPGEVTGRDPRAGARQKGADMFGSEIERPWRCSIRSSDGIEVHVREGRRNPRAVD